MYAISEAHNYERLTSLTITLPWFLSKKRSKYENYKINQASENSLTRTRAETVMSRAKPSPYCTLPRLMKGRFFKGLELPTPLKNRYNGTWQRMLTHTVRCGSEGVPTARVDAVLRDQEYFSAVRLRF